MTAFVLFQKFDDPRARRIQLFLVGDVDQLENSMVIQICGAVPRAFLVHKRSVDREDRKAECSQLRCCARCVTDEDANMV